MSSTAGVLKKNRGKILVAIAALLIALVAVVGSGAYFTSVSSNLGNTFTAGILTHYNDGTVMSLTDMYPGETRTGSITLANTGSVDGDLSLTQTAYTDDAGLNGGNLSEVLDVVISYGGTEVYSGKIADMTDVYDAGVLPAADPDTEVTFEWTVTFPDGDAPPTATTGDNAYQDSSVEVDYAWELVSR